MGGHQEDIAFHPEPRPLSLESQQLSPDTSRPPADSDSNTQGPFPSTMDNDHKGALKSYTSHNFSVPVLPSQQFPKAPDQATLLKFRKSQTRNRRVYSSRNPIVESENYQNYRSRQTRDNAKDMKWPDDLEDLFLDALLDMPKMGRRKFCFNGKLYGRNELISLYLWIGHCETLLPGQRPDETKRRDRKQVSSHIQVLKGFMRGHPSFHILFPKKGAQNEIEDSFKDDPCLRALTQNRLPYRRRNRIEYATINDQPSIIDQPSSPSHPSQLIRPYFFSMWMTVQRPGFDAEDGDSRESPSDNDGSPMKFHVYSESQPREVSNECLEALQNWQSRFPALARLCSIDQLDCDIIHMETSLELQHGGCPEYSELWGRFEILVPGTDGTKLLWRCNQTMDKPADLYGKAKHDPPFENIENDLVPIKYIADVGTCLRVTFPAASWAHALGNLVAMEGNFDESLSGAGEYPIQALRQQYIRQISIYQEIFSSPAPHQSWRRRAIIVWTFKECNDGEKGESVWRHLNPDSPHHHPQSYSPHLSHEDAYPAATPGNLYTEEDLSAWVEGGRSPLQHSTANSLNSIAQTLEIVPQSAEEIEVPFAKYNYHNHGLGPASLPFVSSETREDDVMLVDGQGNNSVEAFIQGGDMNLGDFDPEQNFWSAPLFDNFDASSAFQLVNFGSAAASNHNMRSWDGPVKNQAWDTFNAGFESV